MKQSLLDIWQNLRTRTGRLGLSYLAIIMAMSIGISIVFYNTSSHELGRQVPTPSVLHGYVTIVPNESVPDYRGFFRQRIQEGRGDLLGKLVILNLLTLVGGAFLSYYLARRTLMPIEQAMEAQSRFASDASHELRTPLAVIQTENEVALRAPDLSLKRAKELLHSNLEEVTRLRDMSDGLLHLARGDRSIELQPVWLDDIASEAMNRVIKTAQAKDISIEDAVPHLQVLGDGQSLTRALVVLLDNAIKYSTEKTTVTMSGSLHGQLGTVRVEDIGMGIATEQLPHIFDRFYRADQARSKRQTSGYGLGLSIARKIVEQHQGQIHVTSTLGKGSIFTIRLPLA